VADASALMQAADAFEASLGPIDVWVNSAMVTVYSPISDLTAEEVKRVTDVTYLGYVHGTLAALKHMRPRNSGTSFRWARRSPIAASRCNRPIAPPSTPFAASPSRCAAELIHERQPDRRHGGASAGHQHAAVRLGPGPPRRPPSPVPPIFEPEEAAEAILHAAANPGEREYWLGRSTAWVILGNMLAPSFLDRYLAHNAVEAQSVDEPGISIPATISTSPNAACIAPGAPSAGTPTVAQALLPGTPRAPLPWSAPVR
jgi:hypothetical protein